MTTTKSAPNATAALAHPGRATNDHDLEPVLVRIASEGDTAWAEWARTGTCEDGTLFAMRGVTV